MPEPELSPEQTAIVEADRIYNNYEHIKLYEFLLGFKDSENAELLWRLARACRDVGQMSETPKEKKKQLAYDALEYAKKAVAIDDNNFAAHKVIRVLQ